MAITNKKGKAKTIDDYTAEGKEFYASSKEQALTDSNTLYDGQVKSTNEGYDTQVFEQGRAYENQYRENAVQKAINERQVAESMANLGLRDSGLNRTQQTAVQLSYGNNKAAIDRQKQSSIDSLEFSRRQALDTIEQNRTVANANIEQTYSDRALQYGLDKQSQDQLSYQNIITGRIANGESPTDYEIGMSGWSPEYVKTLKAISDGATTRENYSSLAMYSVEQGKMPSEDIIAKSGLDKTYLQGICNLVNSATTTADYKTIVIGYANAGFMPSDDLIELSGMSKKEVKSLYTNAKKAIKETTTGGSKSPEAPNKSKGIISSTNGFLSRNYQGLLEDNGVMVTDNGDGTVTYFDRNTNKKSTFKKEENPYVQGNNRINPDVYNGTFASGVGYQPDNITIGDENIKLKYEDNTPVETLGRKQNVFRTESNASGIHFWMWSDMLNEYVEVRKNTKNGKWEEII